MRSSASRWCLLTIISSVTAVVCPARPAQAHTFDDVSLEDLARASDVIVIGRVARADALPYGPNALPGIHTRVELRVEEW